MVYIFIQLFLYVNDQSYMFIWDRIVYCYSRVTWRRRYIMFYFTLIILFVVTTICFLFLFPLFGLYPTTHILDYCMCMCLFTNIILYCVLSVTKLNITVNLLVETLNIKTRYKSRALFFFIFLLVSLFILYYLL